MGTWVGCNESTKRAHPECKLVSTMLLPFLMMLSPGLPSLTPPVFLLSTALWFAAVCNGMFSLSPFRSVIVLLNGDLVVDGILFTLLLSSGGVDGAESNIHTASSSSSD